MSSVYPVSRPRRLRRTPALRSLFQETEVQLSSLVLPIFVEEEVSDYVPVSAMPGVVRIPEARLAFEIERYAKAGIQSLMTFGISHHLDEAGSDTWHENGLVARMARICKETVPEMIVMSDTCFCEYTTHGHCGVVHDNGVDNDATLVNLGRQAVAAARAGADFIAPRRRWTDRSRRYAPPWTAPASPTPRSWRIPPNLPRHFMARSAKPAVPP
ncbi:hypothetical protein SODG_002369 [Sodalis praecaptivus]